MESSKSLRATINWSMVIVTILSVGMVGSLWVVQEYLKVSTELLKQKDDYIAAKKTEIKTEVDRVIAYIDYKRITTEQQLKESIKIRVYEANAIATGIYDSYRGLRSDKEIKKMIKEALRPLIFNNGRGYFFIYDMQGNNVLLPFSPLLEGKNLWNFKDSRGQYSIRKTAKMIREKGEGFQRWHWWKPGEAKLMSEKIGFSKHFEAYDWWIGSGEYIEDFEQDVQKATLEWINKIRFGQDGYIFVYDFNGTILAHFEKETIGHNVLQDNSDPYGIKIVGELIRMSQQEGGGFLDYEGRIRPSTGLRAQKIGHSQSVKDWQWAVGAGVYVDAINEDIEVERKNLIGKIIKNILYSFVIFILLLVIIGLILRYISKKTTDHLNIFTRFFEQASTKSIKIDKDAVHFSEFKLLARSANQMVDDRKKAEEALMKSEDRYRSLYDNIPIGVFRTMPEGNILSCNPAFLNMMHIPENADIKEYSALDFCKHTEEMQQFINETMLHGKVSKFEFQVKTLKDEEKFVSFNAVAVKNDKGSICIDATVENITQRKQAEEERETLQNQLIHAQKMEAIGTLAGGIAHDFNNILSAIIGYSELSLSQSEPKTPTHGNLSKIFKAGERAKDLVQQILTFSRQGEYEVLPVQIKFVIKEVIKFIRATLPTTIEIRQNFKNNPTVMADTTQMHQVIMNLCTNAGHAMRDNGGTLEIELESLELDSEFMKSHPELQTGKYIKLTIGDTGIGISPEKLDCIFDPYFTTKEKGKGTGLGLATVHGIVKSHGGTVTVESQVGKGTKFEVYLPLAVGRSETKEDPEPKITGGNERILLVDDEQDIIEVEKEMLEQLGYTVTATNGSNEALQIFANQPDRFDLVISDMTMPKMTGDKLAGELIKIRSDIPVLLCTGFSEGLSEEMAASLGIRGYLMKPVTVRMLSHGVRKVLDKS